MKNSIIILATLMSTFSFAEAKKITLYSVYEGKDLAPIFKPFTDATGIEIDVVAGKSTDLINKIEEEGAETVADLHLDKDIVYFSKGLNKDLYQPLNSNVVTANVPANFVELNQNWTTIFYRSRVIMYNKNKVNPSELSTYEDLASDKWKGRLCVRTSKNSYNEALTGYFIHHFGEAKTLELLKGLVANFAVEPMANDRAVISAVAEGVCDVGIANSYYLPPFIVNDANFATRPFFPNQGTTGAHVNGVGIALTKHSKNVKEAKMLVEYLLSKEIQTPVAEYFFQYPVNSEANMHDILKSFGPFEVDQTTVGEIGAHAQRAVELMKEANYK